MSFLNIPIDVLQIIQNNYDFINHKKKFQKTLKIIIAMKNIDRHFGEIENRYCPDNCGNIILDLDYPMCHECWNYLNN